MKFKQHLIFEEIKILLTELSMDQAIEFAQDMHQGQFRRDEKPYSVHPQAVYSILKSFNVKDKVLLVAAWLHDTIEDTKATYNIIKKKFNKQVADIVKQVSSDPKEIEHIGKPEYLLRKMIKMDNNSLTLKLADRLHNVSDLTSASEKIHSQTMYILAELKDGRVLNKLHKKIIRAIERILDKVK